MSSWKRGNTVEKRYSCCIMGTCCVPWDSEGGLDEPVFRRHIQSLLERGTKHLYVFGTAGEGYAIDDARFDRITAAFAEEMRAGGAEPMVGIISLSLPTVIRRIERACERGVGALSDFASELAEAFENFVAVKLGIDSISYLWEVGRRRLPLRFFLTEANFAAARLMGLDAGLLISLASINWEMARRFFGVGVEGRFEELREYVTELAGLRAEMKRSFSGAAHMDGAFDKLFAKIEQAGFFPPAAAAVRGRERGGVRPLCRSAARELPAVGALNKQQHRDAEPPESVSTYRSRGTVL